MNEVERELTKAKAEKEALLIEVANLHKNFAESLLSGEGNKIKTEINKPIKIKKQRKLIFRIKKFFERIINTIS